VTVEVGQVYEDQTHEAGCAIASPYVRFEVVAVRRRDATLKREADGVQKTVPLAKLASGRWKLLSAKATEENEVERFEAFGRSVP
jgi:hypothetical protein